MVRNRRNLLFFILGYFFPFYLPNSPKTQNSQKMKKIPGDIIILHKRTKNHDHMLHCSWDMVSHGCNYFFILGHFLLFYPPNSPKNQNFTKIKKTLADIIIFYTTASKTKIMFLRYGAWQMYPKHQNFKKMKKTLEISPFYTCVPNIMIRWCTVPEIWCPTHGRTDGRTDGRKKWLVEVGAPPKIQNEYHADSRSYSNKRYFTHLGHAIWEQKVSVAEVHI